MKNSDEIFLLILEHCATHWGKLSTSFINWIFDGSLNLNFHAKNPDYDLKKGQNPINGQNIEVCPSVQKAVFMGFLRSVDKHKKEKRDRNVERYYLRAMFTFSKLKIRTKNCTFFTGKVIKKAYLFPIHTLLFFFLLLLLLLLQNGMVLKNFQLPFRQQFVITM